MKEGSQALAWTNEPPGPNTSAQFESRDEQLCALYSPYFQHGVALARSQNKFSATKCFTSSIASRLRKRQIKSPEWAIKIPPNSADCRVFTGLEALSDFGIVQKL